MRTLLHAGAVLLALAPLAAQTTWIVDAVGGPGTLPTLAAAEAVAAPGDTIVVRPTAVYDFTLTTAKGLTLRGAGPGATQFRGRLTVAGMPATQRFVMRDFTGQSTAPVGALSVVQCAGHVVLDTLSLQGPPPGSGTALAGLAIQDAAQVSVHNVFCQSNGLLTVTCFASTAVFSDCLFLVPAGTNATALSCFGGTAQLVRCQLVGSPALEVSFGNGVPSVTLAGGALVGGGAVPYAARVLSGVLRADSACTLGGPVQGTVVPYESGRPDLVLASPGLASVVGFAGPAGSFAAVALGLPGPRATTALGDVWLDPIAYVLMAVGAPPLQANWVTPVGVSGQPLVAQGVLLHLGALRISPPVCAIVP